MGYTSVPAGLYGTMSVVQQPTNPSVESPGGFTVSVQGSNSLNVPFSYHWQQNDGSGTFTNLPNDRTAALTRSNLTVVENGMQFRCVMAAGDVSATSAVMTVTVRPDSTGPTFLTATRTLNRTNLLLTFSEILLPENATNILNYQVCDVFIPSSCVRVLSATLTNGDMAVLLETEMPDPAGIYAVTATGVTDTNANAVLAPGRAPVNLVTSFRQGVDGYTGTVDTHVRSDNATTSYGTLNAVLADNLSPLCHGLLRFDNLFGTGPGQIPPGATVTSAKLYLQTTNWGNDIRVHRMRVPWSGTSTWNDLGSPNDGVSTNAGGDAVTTPEFTFATVAVGTTVELNVLASLNFWATNGGPNYGWALIDTGDDGYQFNSSEAVDPVSRPQLVVSFTPQTTATPLEIVAQPAPSQTINEGQSATFTFSVTGTRPEAQWYKDGVAIPGASNLSYTITGAVETNSGRYYCVITNLVPSQTNTADAYLLVNPDTNAPVLVSALGTTNTSQIRIVFNKLMQAASINNLGDYALTPAFGGAGLSILGAELQTNGTTLILTTSPRDPFTYYQLTVQNAADAAYRHNVMNPNPTKLLLGSQISLIAPTNEWRYHQDGIDLGTAWLAGDYDDSGWSNGPALFVAKNGTPGNGDLPIQTTLSTSNSASGTLTNTVTYYFRQNFTMPAQAQLSSLYAYHLQVRPILDDGAVFHINGQDARRVGMTNAGPITFGTFANRTQGNDYRFEGPYDLPTTNVVFGGNNLLAVEVHQSSAGSSDVAFAAEVLINIPALEMRVVPALVTGSSLHLTWPPVVGYRLYEADRVEGPYTPVAGNPNGTHSVTITGTPGKFYQLRNP
jgi:hypothetical protein